METLDLGDAGENLICSAIYVRFKRKSGGSSCQLIFARTKVIHDLSIPRAELEAALLNASTGHVVRLSLKEQHKKALKISDSQVVLHWLHCTRTVLKMWVRNRALEIMRLTERDDWRYVGSKDNIADLGTRKGATIEDINPDSDWINGLPWMRESMENLPLKRIDEITLSEKQSNNAKKEKITPECLSYTQSSVYGVVPSEVGERYKFSNYLINPNKYRFRKVVRILAFVHLFLKKLVSKCALCQNR